MCNVSFHTSTYICMSQHIRTGFSLIMSYEDAVYSSSTAHFNYIIIFCLFFIYSSL